MGIKAGNTVSVRHYSSTDLLRSIVLETENETVKLKLTKAFSSFNFFEGDPLVIVYKDGDTVNVASCTISDIGFKDNTIKLKIESVEMMNDRRVYDRFPVSLHADLRAEDSKKRLAVRVKNLSLEGLMISSKAELQEGQPYEIDLYIDQRIISMQVEIMWKKKFDENYDYGLKSAYADFNAKNVLKLHLQILRRDQEEFLESLK